jgi:hypothetical protein
MVRADREGQHPLYRERSWQEADRRHQRQNKKTGWLAKGGYDTVIMVRQLQKVISDNPGPVKIKIQEQGGIQVSSKLQRTNPKLDERVLRQ